MNISELVKSTLEELQDLIISRTVVGEPIQAGDHTVIPVSKVLFGFGGGGAGHDASSKVSGTGEGIGGGWSIEPVAFVIVGPDGPKMLTIGEKESTVAKLIDLAPKVVDKVKDMIESTSEPSDTESESDDKVDK